MENMILAIGTTWDNDNKTNDDIALWQTCRFPSCQGKDSATNILESTHVHCHFSNLNIYILLGIFHLKHILSSGWGREWRAASSLPGWETSSAGNVLTPKWVPFLRSPVWSQGCNAHMEQFMRIKSFYLVYRARPALSVSLFSSVPLTAGSGCGYWVAELGGKDSNSSHPCTTLSPFM